jgi:hypothetical protein
MRPRTGGITLRGERVNCEQKFRTTFKGTEEPRLWALHLPMEEELAQWFVVGVSCPRSCYGLYEK